MASESDREEFSLCGPSHLTSVDWANEHHQRCVAACLVQGIYIVELDRQLKRDGSEALGSPWWASFNFKLIRHLIDDADLSIFGGIYEFKPPQADTVDDSGAPRYVIAFRGTLTKPDSISRDVELDIHIIRNGLHRTSRFEMAMEAVRSMAASVGASSLWLTGHSMGAAMGLLAGKTMARTGIHIKAFLFNPPFVSPPIERIANERVRHGIRMAGSIITAGLALSRTLKQTQQQQQQQQQQQLQLESSALSSWLPDIHVNPGDHLCAEYIGFFEHRATMEQIGYGAGLVERMAMQHSLGGLVMDAMGVKKAVEVEEPVHVIPSANLIVNRTTTSQQDYKEAHGIHQWWRDDQDLVSHIYLFK